MSRPLRFIPGKKTLVEVTTRTIHSRLLLRPSNELNEVVLGILGRAQELYRAQISGYAFLSNHYHILLVVDSAKQLAEFVTYFNSNLAREAGRLVQWREKFWGRRYRAIVVSGEEAAQRERLKYVLSHGAKEGLVSTPQEWPGVHALRPLLTGEETVGIWFDRTQEYAARRRGEDFERLRYATPVTVTLSPLPCWEDLSWELQKRRIEEIAHEIEAETKARLEEKGIPPLGPDAIRRQSPETIPPRSKKSSAPLFLAASKRVRDDLRNAYYSFLAAFREAADEFKAGNRNALFPEGCFPPDSRSSVGVPLPPSRLDDHRDATSRSGMPEKGEALPTPPREAGFLGECHGERSPLVAERNPVRKACESLSEVGAQLHPKLGPTRVVKGLPRVNHQAPLKLVPVGREVVRTQGIDRDEDHRRAREASGSGGGVAPAGGRQKRGRDDRATSNHERRGSHRRCDPPSVRGSCRSGS